VLYRTSVFSSGGETAGVVPFIHHIAAKNMCEGRCLLATLKLRAKLDLVLQRDGEFEQARRESMTAEPSLHLRHRSDQVAARPAKLDKVHAALAA